MSVLRAEAISAPFLRPCRGAGETDLTSCWSSVSVPSQSVLRALYESLLRRCRGARDGVPYWDQASRLLTGQTLRNLLLVRGATEVGSHDATIRRDVTNTAEL